MIDLHSEGTTGVQQMEAGAATGRWEWAKAGGQAARCDTESLPSRTAALVTATR